MTLNKTIVSIVTLPELRKRSRERRETGEQDLFRARLDQIIDMSHELRWLAASRSPTEDYVSSKLMVGRSVERLLEDLFAIFEKGLEQSPKRFSAHLLTMHPLKLLV